MMRLVSVLSTCAATVALWGAPAEAKPDLEAERAAIEAYQQYDQRLQDVGWRLVTANAEFCDNAIASIGLQLQDMRSYGAPSVARSALALNGDFAVQTAAQNSPVSAIANMASNREVVAISGKDLNALPAADRLHWQRLKSVHDFIDERLKENGFVELVFADGASAKVEPERACASRFEVMADSKRAVADGNRVIFGVRFRGFTYAEPMFAAAVAHELAHNILKHRKWLNANNRKRRYIRITEREADRLMPWLLANAGYDPRAALDFMNTWGPRHDGGLFRARTHDGWDERAEFIEAEIPRIERLVEEHGRADWSKHFLRDTGAVEVAQK